MAYGQASVPRQHPKEWCSESQVRVKARSEGLGSLLGQEVLVLGQKPSLLVSKKVHSYG